MGFTYTYSAANRSVKIVGMSYAGAPKSNTAMFVTKKVQHLLASLSSVENCLVFAEEGIEVSELVAAKHIFVFSSTPNLEYARFASRFAEERFIEEQKYEFRLNPKGYYVSEDVCIPRDAYIEPGCVIGPDVHIGKQARILAGTVIKHATIGDNFLSNECAIIGANGFTMTEDECGNKLRIPTLGRVTIGNSVEIGAHDNVSCGSGGDTIIEDFVKIDALVHIGHDVHLHKNVEITAGGIIGGFDDLGEHAYVGINAVLRNRIGIGAGAIVGMGAVVTKSIEDNVTVAGNPARLFSK